MLKSKLFQNFLTHSAKFFSSLPLSLSPYPHPHPHSHSHSAKNKNDFKFCTNAQILEKISSTRKERVQRKICLMKVLLFFDLGDELQKKWTLNKKCQSFEQNVWFSTLFRFSASFRQMEDFFNNYFIVCNISTSKLLEMKYKTSKFSGGLEISKSKCRISSKFCKTFDKISLTPPPLPPKRIISGFARVFNF